MADWNDISSHPSYTSLSEEEKKRVQENFYSDHVATKIGDSEENRSIFFNDIVGRPVAPDPATDGDSDELLDPGNVIGIKQYDTPVGKINLPAYGNKLEFEDGAEVVGTAPVEAFKRGLKKSSTGSFVYAPEDVQYPTRTESIAEMLGTMTGDLPFMAAGGAFAAAPAGPAGIITGPAGAFALPEAIKHVNRRAWEEGAISTPSEFIDRLGTTVGAAERGYATGLAMGKLSEVLPGATNALVDKIGSPVVRDVAGRVLPQLAKTTGEVAAMTGVPAALEMQAPTLDEVINAGIMVGGMHAAPSLWRGAERGLNRAGEFYDKVKTAKYDNMAPEGILASNPVVNKLMTDTLTYGERKAPAVEMAASDPRYQKIAEYEKAQELAKVERQFESGKIFSPQELEIAKAKVSQNATSELAKTVEQIRGDNSAKDTSYLDAMTTGELGRHHSPEFINNNQVVGVKKGLPNFSSDIAAVVKSENVNIPVSIVGKVYDKLRGRNPQAMEGRINETSSYLETPQRVFDRLPAVFKDVWTAARQATHVATKEIRKVHRDVKELKRELGLKKDDSERVGTFMASVNKGGIETIKTSMPRTYAKHKDMIDFISSNIGKMSTEDMAKAVLSSKQQLTRTFMQSKYKEYYERVNAARRYAGLNEFPPVEDYYTFMRNAELLAREGIDVTSVRYKDTAENIGESRIGLPEGVDAQKYAKFMNEALSDLGKSDFATRIKTRARMTGFEFARDRKFGALEPIELDALHVFQHYASKAIPNIMISPVVTKARNLSNKMTATDATGKKIEVHLAETNPQLYTWLQEFTDTISGKPEPSSILWVHPETASKIRRLSRNIGIAMMVGNVGTLLKQPGAFMLAGSELGVRWLAQGMAANLDPKWRKFAMDESAHLLSRTYDVALDAPSYGFTKKVSATQDWIADKGMKPIQLLDREVAQATWLAAYMKARAKGQAEFKGVGANPETLAGKGKMSHDEAVRYADETTIRTQGSAAKQDISRIQRNALGRSLSLFQTFGINQYGYLVRDVLGLRNPDMSKAQVATKAIRFIAWAGMINTFYEVFLGMDAPFAAPVTAAYDALTDTKGKKSVAHGVGMEIASMLPYMGSVKFGKSPFGANFQLIEDIAHTVAGTPGGKGAYDIMAKLGGFPAYKIIQYIENPELHFPVGQRYRDMEKILDEYRKKKQAEKKSSSGGRLSIVKIGKI